MTRRQSKAVRQQVKASLIQIGLGFAAGLIMSGALFLSL
jgi:hypothetical protein